MGVRSDAITEPPEKRLRGLLLGDLSGVVLRPVLHVGLLGERDFFDYDGGSIGLRLDGPRELDGEQVLAALAPQLEPQRCATPPLRLGEGGVCVVALPEPCPPRRGAQPRASPEKRPPLL